MPRYPLIIAAICLLPLAGWSRDARQAFVEAPSTVLPTLPEITRLDMLDYYDAGSMSASTNILEGKSRVTAATPGRVDVILSEAASLSIAVLPAGRDTVVAVVSTLSAPGEMSFLTLYDKEWREIVGVLPEPSLKEWTIPEAKKVMDDIENAVPFVAARYEIDSATGILTMTPRLKEIMDPVDYNKIISYFKPRLTYKWTGKKFKIVDGPRVEAPSRQVDAK